MLKRLLLLALLAAGGWLVYRSLRPGRLPAPGPQLSPEPPAPVSRVSPAWQPPADAPPPTAPAWPADPAPAAAEVADQAAGRGDLGAPPPAPEAARDGRAPAPEAAEQAAPQPAQTGAPAGGERTHEGYCMRCKQRRTMADVSVVVTESGRHAARGSCPVCGAKMSKFLPGH